LILEKIFLDILGKYGADPWRTLIGIIFLWLGFSGLYYYFDDFYIDNAKDLTRIGRSLYHSTITFF